MNSSVEERGFLVSNLYVVFLFCFVGVHLASHQKESPSEKVVNRLGEAVWRSHTVPVPVPAGDALGHRQPLCSGALGLVGGGGGGELVNR